MRKIEFLFPLDVLEYKIFGLFQILRESNRFNSAEEPIQLVLFLITMFKDGHLNAKSLNNHDSIEKFHETLEYLINGEHNKAQYKEIVSFLHLGLSKIEPNTFNRMCDLLSEMDRKLLKENFTSIFDDILYRVSQSQGRFAGEFIQPIELTRFMSGLADLNKNAKVFNPFAGLASFGIYLDKGHVYFGQELNKKTWALGALRLMAFERSKNSKYTCDDSILNWPESSEKFDLIISNPPFGMKLGNQFKSIDSNIRTIEQFLIEKGINSLKQNGKLIALLPQGFLFSDSKFDKDLRKNLVDNDLIDTIISLPGGLLLNTGIPLVILVLSRSKKNSNKVKFIDAKKFVNLKESGEKVLNDYAFNGFIHGNRKDDEVIQIVTNQQISDNKYNLSIARYFQKKIIGVKLGSLLEFVKGQRVNIPEKGKLIRIRNLKDDNIDFTLDVSSVEESELKRPDIHILTESCLLLAMRWKSLKPTWFEFKDEAIFRSNDVLSFKVNESRVDKAYLINELHADYVLKQLDGYRLGASVIPTIRKDDLMEVVIKLPSLKEQRERVQGIYELSNKFKILQGERDTLIHGRSIKQFNEFASLKHTLGRPRQNILDWSDNLLDFLHKNREEIEILNKSFAEFYQVDIVSALKEIKRDVNFITDVLEKGENGLVLSEFEKQTISLYDINTIIVEMSNNGFNFQIIKLLLEGESLNEKGIYANQTLFKTLLVNILTNANKYAFEKKTTGNELVIELTEVDDYLILEIKNNGNPFPKNFDREKFITKYSTSDSHSGSGLGGYDIHRIATDFNNPDWILSLNEDPLFPVKFKFQFPIIPIQ